MTRPYRVCTRCLMDTSDPLIEFDRGGRCNHCRGYDQLAAKFLRHGPEGAAELAGLVQDIKRAGRGREYDCVIGVSGGVDSSYLAWVVHRLGLRPLAVHMDNGWDSELAVHNIERVLKQLNIDLYTYVVDWEEFRDLHLAFLRASVPDAEIPTDHAILAVIFRVAAARRIRFGKVPLRSYPAYTRWDWLRYAIVRRLRVLQLLNYVSYTRREAIRTLEDDLGWRNYGGKHFESVYTRFFQGYILPKKFNIDKRRAHLSTLICSGQITREDALQELGRNPYLGAEAEADREYVVKKLGLTDREFGEILNSPARTSADYPTHRDFDPWYSTFVRAHPLRGPRRRARTSPESGATDVTNEATSGEAPPRRRRIAYLTDVLTVHDSRFLEQLLRGPFEPTLILFHAPTPKVDELLRQYPDLRVRWHRFEIAPPARRPRILGPLRRARATWRAVLELRRDLRAVRPDLLHAGWVQTCGAVSAFSGFRPLLLMPWGSDILLWPRTSRRERWLAQRALRACDAVACDADTVRIAVQELCPIPRHRFAVFPWGIEIDRFTPARRDPALRASWGPEGCCVLLMTRSFEPIYGVDIFLDALALARRKAPSLRAVLVGGGSLESSLRDRAQQLGLNDILHFVGQVPNDRMGALVASSDIYVSSSLSDGTSLSLLEAMASGLPVVVSDLPANREWVEEGVNGRLVPRGQPQALAEACLSLIENPDRRRQMGERNLALARERADWDRNFARCADLYRQVIARRSSSEAS
ncbi:MAG: glycosyltransferase [Planctomycetes bacterium]|nr:glycosyltransferase [Planctomycetota bacterium]